ncbi:MAG: sulfatase-like hydrolase/transferase [Planctomycetes bacterium]|nr:sulfatase-like hydrolase/transferase [Planctomycetota bacterium]
MQRFIAMAILLIAPMARAAQKPNILFIFADDLGYGDLSSYGATDLKSPNIDALIASGMRFDNFYANCCVCSPSRASAMTGWYPERVGVPGLIRTPLEDNWGYLSPEAVLIPTMLKRAGYHTAIVGKWNLGLSPENWPNARGFDLFHGFLDDMMEDYYTHRRFGINYMRLNDKEVDPKGHATDIFTDWAIEDIQARAKSGEPFFLYLAYNAPHFPIQPPDDWLAKVKAREPNITDKRAKIVALIEHLDDRVGKVIAALKEAGVYENTLIVFTSDNGGDLGHGATCGKTRDGKGSMYEGGLRVPGAIIWPGHIQSGSRTDAIALTMDLFPTFCEAAGVAIDHEIDGVSLMPTLRGEKQANLDRPLFWTRREGGNRYMGMTIHAARIGPWKLVKNLPTEPFELYNVADDPMEAHDMSSSAKKELNDLSRRLRSQIQAGGSVPWQKPGGPAERPQRK